MVLSFLRIIHARWPLFPGCVPLLLCFWPPSVQQAATFGPLHKTSVGTGICSHFSGSFFIQQCYVVVVDGWRSCRVGALLCSGFRGPLFISFFFFRFGWSLMFRRRRRLHSKIWLSSIFHPSFSNLPSSISFTLLDRGRGSEVVVIIITITVAAATAGNIINTAFLRPLRVGGVGILIEIGSFCVFRCSFISPFGPFCLGWFGITGRSMEKVFFSGDSG